MAAQIPTLDEIRDAVRQVVREEMAAAASPDVMTTEQAAAYADRTAKTIRNWVESGALPASRRGRLLSIRKDDLDRYLAGEPAQDEQVIKLLRP